MGFGDFETAMKMRDTVTRLMISVLDHERPPYRYGTVISIDPDGRTCTVRFPGGATDGSNDVSVKLGSIQPQTTGQTVRVDGYNGDKFVADVLGKAVLTTTIADDLPIPTSVVLTQAPGQVTLDWADMNTTDAPVDSYEVEFAESADFLTNPRAYTTVSSIFSVPYDPGTVVWARVRSLNGSGGSSDWNTSGSVTVSDYPAPGGTTDGLPPASSPIPVVTEGLGFLTAQWVPVLNADFVTYDVYLSTVSGFTPGPSTLIGSTESSFFMIDADASNTKLVYGTTYFIRIVARDADGSATAGAQASGVPQRVELGDVGNVPSSAISDGVAPAASPGAPTIKNGIGFLYVTWAHISNPDSATYEIHVGTSSGFIPDANSYVGETNSDFTFIRTQGAGTGYAPLVYGTTYWIKLWAKDQDGYAPNAGAGASGTTLQVAAFDISVGAVTATAISAGAVTSTALSTGAVTATAIAANAVDSTKIAANAVTTTAIAANAVTQAQIAANAVGSIQITAGAVTATQIGAGAVGTPALAASAVTANELAAGAVTANKLSVVVGGGNLLPNSSFEDNTLGSWAIIGSLPPTVSVSTAQVFHGTHSALVSWATGSTGPLSGFKTTYNVVAGQSYVASAWVLASGTGVQMAAYGTAVGAAQFLTNVSSVGSWSRIIVKFTATVTGLITLQLLPATTTGAGATAYMDAVQLELGDVATAYAPKPDEILPGTIVANMIQAGTITGDRLVGNTITAAQIAANTITAAQIAANTVTAAQIAANTITAGQIAANTITAAQIAGQTITATELAAGAVTANKLSVIMGGGNLQPNSSFEVDTSGWSSAVGSPTIARSNAVPAYHGGWVGAITSTAAGNFNTYELVPVVEGQVYTASGYIRHNTAGRQAKLSFQFYSAAFAATGAAADVTVNPTTTGWTRVTSTYTAPAGSAWAVPVYAYTGAAAAGETMYLDAVQVEAGEIATAYSPKPDEVLPGTIVASMIAANTITGDRIFGGTITSTQLASGAVTANKLNVIMGGGNLLGNSSFEVDTSGWGGAINTSTFVRSTARAYDGVASALFTSGDVAGTPTDTYMEKSVPVPNGTYTVSAWIYLTGAGITFGGGNGRDMMVYAWGNTAVVNYDRTKLNQWQRVLTTVVVTTGTITVRFYTPSGAAMNIDAVQVENGDVATAYAPKTDEILPGTIVTNMMTANTINGDRIQTNTLNADRIVSNSITATSAIFQAGAIQTAWIGDLQVTTGKIGLLQVNTAQIANGAITDLKVTDMTADKITVGNLKVAVMLTTGALQTATSGARVTLNSAGLKAYNSGGTPTVQINSDGSATFAGTVTATAGQIGGWSISGNNIIGTAAGNIQTSASGSRVVIDGPNDLLALYDSGNNLQAQLDGTNGLTVYKGLIQGATYQTAASGRRIVMSGTFVNEIDFYSGDATETINGQIQVSVQNDGTNQYGILTLKSPQTSASPNVTLSLGGSGTVSGAGVTLNCTNITQFNAYQFTVQFRNWYSNTNGDIFSNGKMQATYLSAVSSPGYGNSIADFTNQSGASQISIGDGTRWSFVGTVTSAGDWIPGSAAGDMMLRSGSGKVFAQNLYTTTYVTADEHRTLPRDGSGSYYTMYSPSANLVRWWTGGTDRMSLSTGAVFPSADGGLACGGTGNRWANIFSTDTYWFPHTGTATSSGTVCKRATDSYLMVASSLRANKTRFKKHPRTREHDILDLLHDKVQTFHFKADIEKGFDFPELIEVGMVAEDVHEAGFTELVQYEIPWEITEHSSPANNHYARTAPTGEPARPTGIHYDRFGVVLLPVVKDHDDQLIDHEDRIAKLERALAGAARK